VTRSIRDNPIINYRLEGQLPYGKFLIKSTTNLTAILPLMTYFSLWSWFASVKTSGKNFMHHVVSYIVVLSEDLTILHGDFQLSMENIYETTFFLCLWQFLLKGSECLFIFLKVVSVKYIYSLLPRIHIGLVVVSFKYKIFFNYSMCNKGKCSNFLNSPEICILG
jgi:hypothetical protein